jgi:hypothetical protein
MTSVQVEIRTEVFIPSDRAELFEFEDLGYKPHDVPPVVSRSRQALPLVIWVAENIGTPAALLLGQAVARWLLRKRGDRAKEGRIPSRDHRPSTEPCQSYSSTAFSASM